MNRFSYFRYEPCIPLVAVADSIDRAGTMLTTTNLSSLSYVHAAVPLWFFILNMLIRLSF